MAEQPPTSKKQPAGGWLKLWRSWLHHEVARDAKAWLVLTHILCRAAVTPRANRRLGYTLQPGQCDETEEQLAQATGLTRKEVRGSLARLGQYGTITKGQILGQRRNVITLVNWAFYNPPAENRAKDGAKEGPTKGPTKGPRKGQERANPEEVQKEKTTTPSADALELSAFLRDRCNRQVGAGGLQKLIDNYGLEAVVGECEERALTNGLSDAKRPLAVIEAVLRDGEAPAPIGVFKTWRRAKAAPAGRDVKAEAAAWAAELEAKERAQP